MQQATIWMTRLLVLKKAKAMSAQCVSAPPEALTIDANGNRSTLLLPLITRLFLTQEVEGSRYKKQT